MPWTEQLANPDELRRCISDLVALSTLPAAWRNYDMRQIGDSIVAALVSMLDADFVFIALPSHGNQLTELIRSHPKLNPARLDHVRTMLQRENAKLNGEQEFIAADASGGNDLWVGGDFTRVNDVGQQGLTRFTNAPGGSQPSVPVRLKKSPDPFGRRGLAQGRPQSSCSMATGKKYVSAGWTLTGAARARRSGGARLVPMASAMAGMT